MSDKNIRNVIKSHIANTKAKREMIKGGILTKVPLLCSKDAWAVVAYVIVMPWTMINKPDFNTSPFRVTIKPKTNINKIAKKLMEEMNKKKWRA